MENGEYGYEERTVVGPDESGAFYAAGTLGRVADHRMRCARTDISALRGYQPSRQYLRGMIQFLKDNLWEVKDIMGIFMNQALAVEQYGVEKEMDGTGIH